MMRENFQILLATSEASIIVPTFLPPLINHVEFFYENRPDTIVSYASGYRVETRKRLVRVRVESRDLYTLEMVHTRDYDISYDSESHWSLVRSIQLFGRNRADFLPPMRFEYTEVEPRTIDGENDF